MTAGGRGLTAASLVGGVLAVLTSAFLAAVFLTAEAARQGNRDLVAACRQRALAAGIADRCRRARRASPRCTTMHRGCSID